MQLCHTKCNPLSALWLSHMLTSCAFPWKSALAALHFLLHTRSCISFQPPPRKARKVQGERAQSARAFLTQMKDYYDFQFLCVRASLRYSAWATMNGCFPPFCSCTRSRPFVTFTRAFLSLSLFLRPARVVGALRFLYTRATLAHSLFFSWQVVAMCMCVCVFHLILRHE